MLPPRITVSRMISTFSFGRTSTGTANISWMTISFWMSTGFETLDLHSEMRVTNDSNLTEAEDAKLTLAYLTERTEAFQMSFRNMEARLEKEISRLLLSIGFPTLNEMPTISLRKLKSAQCTYSDQFPEIEKSARESKIIQVKYEEKSRSDLLLVRPSGLIKYRTDDRHRIYRLPDLPSV